MSNYSISKLDRLLPKIAAALFIGGSSTCYGYYRYNRSAVIKEATKMFETSEYMAKSLELLEKYPSLDSAIGKPYERKRFNVYDSFNERSNTFAKVAVPVEGSHSTAFLLSWASQHVSKDSNSSFWRVDRLDLKKQDRQFTFYLHPELYSGGHPDAFPSVSYETGQEINSDSVNLTESVKSQISPQTVQ